MCGGYEEWARHKRGEVPEYSGPSLETRKDIEAEIKRLEQLLEEKERRKRLLEEK